MCVRKPGEGYTLLRGLAHPLVANIGETGLLEASGAGTKTSEVSDHLDTRSNCKGKDQEVENGSDNAGNVHGMQPSEENVVVPKEINLSGVLDSLMSLDPKGDFMGPLDGFSAPNHSKVIEASMCFAMMQEKIRTQQYSTWRMFVEDFEWMCHNTLRCNQKRSIIWAAANDLLRRGKKRLEQYERWGESLVALNKTGGSLASFDSKLGVPTKCKSENVDARDCQLSNPPILKGLKMVIPSNTTGSAESKPPSSGAASMCKDAAVGKDTCSIQRPKEEKRDDQKTRSITPFLAPVLDIVSEETSAQKDAIGANVSREVQAVDSRHRVLDSNPSAVGQQDEDVDVEEDRDVDSDDYRAEFDGEATESSSSYDSAGSALEGEVGSDRMQSMFEADSEFRDGNGAGGLVEDDDGLLTAERGTKALDPVWKQHRRGIEWRCRWLELRTKEIKAKLSLYDKSLKSLQSAKIWKWEGEVGEGTSARTVPVKILRNHPVIHRKHRRRPEDAEGDLGLGRHPVFSRYEKRKTPRKSDDGLAQEKVDSQQDQQTEFEKTIFEKVHVKQQPAADSVIVEEDSLELLLWQIEALQARVHKLQNTLRKGAGLRRASTQAVPRGGTPSSSSAGMGRSGSGSARRRTSDYDINDIVMPVNVGSSTVQEVRHLNIETPGWRHVEDATQGNVGQASSNDATQGNAGQESSSAEEIEDEDYERRHARMEALERQQRSMLPQKRNAGETRTVGKGNLGMGKSGAKMAGEGSPSLALPSGPLSTENVPKKQRSNRNTGRRQFISPPLAPAAPASSSAAAQAGSSAVQASSSAAQASSSAPQASSSAPQASSSAAQASSSAAQASSSDTKRKSLEDVAVEPDIGPSGLESGDPPTTQSMDED